MSDKKRTTKTQIISFCLFLRGQTDITAGYIMERENGRLSNAVKI